MHEIDEKVDRLARLAHAAGVGGVLLNTQPNFAWLTAGRSNRIDGSRESGNGSLLVTVQGERFVIANNIEMPRLHEEALAGLGFTPCEYAWTDEQADAGRAIAAARTALGGSDVGCDNGLSGGAPLERHIAAARTPLTRAEIARYRTLGCEIGRALGVVCRSLTPGMTETEIAGRIAATVHGVNARPLVTLVAADHRIARYRHPTATDTAWHHCVLVALCAQRDGLVVSASRLVAAGGVPQVLADRTVATARVFEQLLTATLPGAPASHLFGVAARAYVVEGFAGEETRHHQGGAIGYRTRDWIAHPASHETVRARQALAWNPTITGTKVEDTALLTEDGLEIITSSPAWPTIPLSVRGRPLIASGVLAV
jgi:Xaa-Pro aminopeptidase